MIAGEALVEGVLYTIVEEEDALLRSAWDALLADESSSRTWEEPASLCTLFGAPAIEEEVIVAVGVVVDGTCARSVGVEWTDVLGTSHERLVVGVADRTVAGYAAEEELSEVVPTADCIVGRFAGNEDVVHAVVVEVSNLEVAIAEVVRRLTHVEAQVVEGYNVLLLGLNAEVEIDAHGAAQSLEVLVGRIIDVALYHEVGIAVVVEVGGGDDAKCKGINEVTIAHQVFAILAIDAVAFVDQHTAVHDATSVDV